MKFCILIFSCGRNNYLEATLKSFKENIIFPEGSIIHKILIDDMPVDRDLKFLKNTASKYNIDQLILNKTNTGISATVQQAWKLIPEGFDYIWHQEDDFIFNRKIEIEKFVQVLCNPVIYQIACLRQPWTDREKMYGGIFQSEPAVFKEAHVNDCDIVVHREYFTHNPCLYRANVPAQIENYSEYTFKEYLLKKAHGYFAYWGKLTDSPLVHHIGEEKKGVGQL